MSDWFAKQRQRDTTFWWDDARFGKDATVATPDGAQPLATATPQDLERAAPPVTRQPPPSRKGHRVKRRDSSESDGAQSDDPLHGIECRLNCDQREALARMLVQGVVRTAQN